MCPCESRRFKSRLCSRLRVAAKQLSSLRGAIAFNIVPGSNLFYAWVCFNCMRRINGNVDSDGLSPLRHGYRLSGSRFRIAQSIDSNDTGGYIAAELTQVSVKGYWEPKVAVVVGVVEHPTPVNIFMLWLCPPEFDIYYCVDRIKGYQLSLLACLNKKLWRNNETNKNAFLIRTVSRPSLCRADFRHKCLRSRRRPMCIRHLEVLSNYKAGLSHCPVS